MPKRNQLTEAEREQRRAADRAFVQQAVEQLRSSDGWQRWLTTRRHFDKYCVVILRGTGCRRVDMRGCARRHVVDDVLLACRSVGFACGEVGERGAMDVVAFVDRAAEVSEESVLLWRGER
jgi:hypothetical protein